MSNPKIRYSRLRIVISLFVSSALAVLAASAAAQKTAQFDQQAVADFYKDKTIRIIVPYPPGGGYDLNARLLARHLGRHTPGNPNFIVQNMPGAGGLLGPRFVYTVAPKDGTVIGTTNQFFVLQQALGQPGIDFDHRKFNWLGSTHKPIGQCAIRSDLDINGVEEIIAGREVFTAASRPGSSGYDIPAVLNGALGTRFKLVTGYSGIAPILAAMERKEVDAFCSADPLHPAMTPILGGEDPAAKVVVTLLPDSSGHPRLKGVPTAEALAKTDEARALVRALAAPLNMAFPWAVAPEVPPERVAALRRSMAQTFADPKFLAEAKKVKAGINFSTGEEVTLIVNEVLNTPQAQVAKLKKALE